MGTRQSKSVLNPHEVYNSARNTVNRCMTEGVPLWWNIGEDEIDLLVGLEMIELYVTRRNNILYNDREIYDGI